MLYPLSYERVASPDSTPNQPRLANPVPCKSTVPRYVPPALAPPEKTGQNFSSLCQSNPPYAPPAPSQSLSIIHSASDPSPETRKRSLLPRPCYCFSAPH